jgi:P4 family phage/plasmid primase-like protien
MIPCFAPDVDVSEWDELLPLVPGAPGISGAAPALGDIPLRINRNPQIPETVMALLLGDLKFRRTWERQRDDDPTLQDKSLSGYEMALASLAAHAGLDDQPQLVCDILAAFRAKERGAWHGRSYFRSTVGKALAAAKARRERRNGAGGHGVGGDPDGATEDALHEEDAATAAGAAARGSGDAARRAIADRLLVRLREEKKIRASDLARIILWERAFARDAANNLYFYCDEGYYHPGGDAHIRERVKRIFIAIRREKEWTSRVSEETITFIAADARWLWSQPPLDTINVDNGLLHLRTRELKPHSPDYLSPVRIAVTYDPSATCPAIDAFIAQVFPSDSMALAYELPAAMLTPERITQRAILLLGEGANGKSTYLLVVVRFIGAANTASLSLQELENDRFASAELFARLANICPDLPISALGDTSVFKRTVAGDRIRGQQKFRPAFEFEPYCKFVFSATRMPANSDDSNAFLRRWLVVPFERTFRDDAPGTVPQGTLLARLTTPGELSGLLNRVMDAWDRLHAQGGFTRGASMIAAAEDLRQTLDPFYAWLTERVVAAPEGFIVGADLRRKYAEDCRIHKRPQPTDKQFSQMLRRTYPAVEARQRRVNRALTHCYIGIAWLATESAGLHDEGPPIPDAPFIEECELGPDDAAEGVEPEPRPADYRVGDFLQWQVDGEWQLPAPRPIERFSLDSEGNSLVFFVGMASAARREDLRVVSRFREGEIVRWERYGEWQFREPQRIQGFTPKQYYAIFELDRPVPDPHGKGGVFERRRIYAPVWQLRPAPNGGSGVEEHGRKEIRRQDSGEGSKRKPEQLDLPEYPD